MIENEKPTDEDESEEEDETPGLWLFSIFDELIGPEEEESEPDGEEVNS